MHVLDHFSLRMFWIILVCEFKAPDFISLDVHNESEFTSNLTCSFTKCHDVDFESVGTIESLDTIEKRQCT